LLVSAEPGVRYPPGDQEFLVEQLSRLLLHPEEATELGHYGRKAVERFFNGTSWTSTTNSLGATINVSVPEPGTLLLGGIAAACGSGGVWWRRKRKAAPVVREEAVAAG
ncbi:MAG: PEP-CTERM sorting domain-containing protein, partial [Gemmataceae bacterium]